MALLKLYQLKHWLRASGLDRTLGSVRIPNPASLHSSSLKISHYFDHFISLSLYLCNQLVFFSLSLFCSLSLFGATIFYRRFKTLEFEYSKDPSSIGVSLNICVSFIYELLL